MSSRKALMSFSKLADPIVLQGCHLLEMWPKNFLNHPESPQKTSKKSWKSSDWLHFLHLKTHVLRWKGPDRLRGMLSVDLDWSGHGSKTYGPMVPCWNMGYMFHHVSSCVHFRILIPKRGYPGILPVFPVLSAKGVMYHLDFESLGQALCKAGFFLIPESLFRGWKDPTGNETVCLDRPNI